MKTDRGTRGQPIEVHRDGAVEGKAQSVIAIAPIFDEGDIRMALGSCSGHRAMIPPLSGLGAHCVVFAKPNKHPATGWMLNIWPTSY